MNSRAQLHSVLQEALPGVALYYQPPENIKLTYPCVVYTFDKIKSSEANNSRYIRHDKYTIKLIGSLIDVEKWSDKILGLRYCDLDTTFVSDGLYHYVYQIYI